MPSQEGLDEMMLKYLKDKGIYSEENILKDKPM